MLFKSTPPLGTFCAFPFPYGAMPPGIFLVGRFASGTRYTVKSVHMHGLHNGRLGFDYRGSQAVNRIW